MPTIRDIYSTNMQTRYQLLYIWAANISMTYIGKRYYFWRKARAKKMSFKTVCLNTLSNEVLTIWVLKRSLFVKWESACLCASRDNKIIPRGNAHGHHVTHETVILRRDKVAMILNLTMEVVTRFTRNDLERCSRVDVDVRMVRTYSEPSSACELPLNRNASSIVLTK